MALSEALHSESMFGYIHKLWMLPLIQLDIKLKSRIRTLSRAEEFRAGRPENLTLSLGVQGMNKTVTLSKSANSAVSPWLLGSVCVLDITERTKEQSLDRHQ